jgi:hypothetical protein
VAEWSESHDGERSRRVEGSEARRYDGAATEAAATAERGDSRIRAVSGPGISLLLALGETKLEAPTLVLKRCLLCHCYTAKNYTSSMPGESYGVGVDSSFYP